MEAFKTILFGISGISMIFWVAVIGIWHVDMFPRFFREDRLRDRTPSINPLAKDPEIEALPLQGALRPSVLGTSLLNRGKYSRKSFVVADFSPVDDDYSVNRLYTLVMFSLSAMSFLVITYGLHSRFT